MQQVQKGLTASIFRNNYGRCDINKMKDKETVTIINLGNRSEISEPTEDAPAVRIVTRIIHGKTYMHIEPVEPGSYAFGGSYVATSDSRFHEVSPYPLPLHDRQMNLEGVTQHRYSTVTLLMSDTKTGEEVSRTIDISNITVKATAAEQRKELQEWIVDRGNEQHATTLELISFTIQ